MRPPPRAYLQTTAQQAGDEGHGLDDNPECRAEAKQQEQSMVVLDLGEAVRVPGRDEGQEDGDGDDVVEDRGKGRGGEAAGSVQHGSHQADRSVGEQLGREQAQQISRHLTLRDDAGAVAADGVQVDDPRSRKEEHDCGAEKHAGRQSQHGGYRFNCLLLRASRQAGDEDRDERRREDAAENEVVNDVRCVVGEVERVGKRRVPERVDRDEDAQQSGYLARRACRLRRRQSPCPGSRRGRLAYDTPRGAVRTRRPCRRAGTPDPGQSGGCRYPGQRAR